MSDNTPIPVNKSELADLFEVSLPTVDEWIKDGCPVEQEGSNGVPYVFDARKVLAWRRGVEDAKKRAADERAATLAQLQLSLTGGASPDAGPVLTGKDRIDALNAALLEDRLKRERKKVVPVEDVRADYQALFQLLRQRLLPLGVMLKRTAGLGEEQVRAVDAEVRGLLRDLSRQIADPALRPSGPDVEAEGLTDAA